MTTFDSARPIVIGNWKQNTDLRQAEQLAHQIAHQQVDRVQRAVCPPAIWLATVRDALASAGIALGAQTSSATQDGAYTGEISARMIAEVCSFVLVGHSERRALFGETDAVVADKVRLALEAGLGVVLCVGESADERDRGVAEAIVARQIERGLTGGATAEPDLVIAYEPVWAIGTGRSATPDDASRMTQTIAGEVSRLIPGATVPIVYGGSVSASNAAALIQGEHVSGFLVGGASLRADEFHGICQAARPAD